MAELPITIFRMNTPDGERDYVTCLSHEHVSMHGVPKEAVIGMLTQPLDPDKAVITPAVFARNAVFVEFMQGLIARRGPQLLSLRAEGREQDGKLFVIDRRTPAPDKEVPRRDVFGAFQIRDGQLLPGSYQPNKEHMILSEDGLFRLPAGLESALLEELAALRTADEKPDTNRPAPGPLPGSGRASEPMGADDEVDPVAEAEVYIAYGRDAQAEEILAEALQEYPTRGDVRAKLLEVRARLGDAKAPAQVAARERGQTYRVLGLPIGKPSDWAYFGAFIALYVAGWVATQYDAILPFFIALPWIVLWLCWKFPRTFRLERPALIGPELAWIALPGVGLLMAANHVAVYVDVHYFSVMQVMLPAAGLVVAMLACYAWIEPAFRSGRGLISLILAGVVSMPYSAGALLNVNTKWDSSDPEVRRVRVEEKWTSKGGRGGGTTYHVRVSPWGKAEIKQLFLREHVYEAVPKGGVLCMRSRRGLLGISWYVIDNCTT